jgi:8-oxo-dGTP pyrophosphatase MutT (NUDIX family)
MRQPIQVCIYLVRPAPAGWEYLVLRRVPRLGGFWQGVTGAIEEGEAAAAAAARELFEETGLVPRALAETGYTYSFAMEDRWRPLYAPGVEEIVEHVFVAVANEGVQEPTLSHEHDAWQWCDLDRALQLLKWPENIEGIQRCDAWLRANR